MVTAQIVKYVCLGGLVLFLSACTTSDQAIILENHEKAYKIVCGGMPWSDPSDCHDRADYACKNMGYSVISEGEQDYAHSESYWKEATYSMIIQCNPSSGAPPSQ